MNKQRLKFAIILTFLLSGLLSNAFGQKKIALKYKLHLGNAYSKNMKMNQDITFVANGQTVTLSQEMDMETTVTVQSINNDKTFTLVSHIDRIRMKQNIFGVEMFYDSQDSSTFSSGMGKKMGEVLNKIIGTTYSMTFDRFGNEIKMNLNIFISSGNSNMVDNLNQTASYAVFPKKKIQIGDSWETDITPLNNLTMQVHTKYTLLKVKGKKAIIGFESIISSNDKAGGNASEMNISGMQKGKMTINIKTGWLMKSTNDQEMKLDLNQKGMYIPAEISGTIEMTSKKK